MVSTLFLRLRGWGLEELAVHGRRFCWASNTQQAFFQNSFPTGCELGVWAADLALDPQRQGRGFPAHFRPGRPIVGKGTGSWGDTGFRSCESFTLLSYCLDPDTARFRVTDKDLWNRSHSQIPCWMALCFNSLFSNFSCQCNSQPIIYKFMSMMRGSPCVERC